MNIVRCLSRVLLTLLVIAGASSVHAQQPRRATAASDPQQGLASQAVPAVVPQALAPTSAAPAKLAGKTRIGVPLPKTQLTQAAPGTDSSEALRTSLMSFMAGPAIEIVPITARLQSQIDAEAKEKTCDFVLYSALTQKHSGGSGFGSLMKGGTSLISMVPMVGMAGGMAGMVAGQAASVAAGAAMSSSIKAKDDVSFEYKLMPADATQALLAKVEKAKATADGEDVITPLVEHAAEAILTAIKK
jgi:hypothetical protein